MKNPVLRILYYVWLALVMVPAVVVWTIVTATFTMAACSLGGGRWAGYYPQVLWARVFCWLAFVRVRVSGRENVEKNRSYMFLANHQGAYDIFSIYGYLGHNFRWMMKEPLRKIPFVGFACAASRQVFVNNSSIAGIKATIAGAEDHLRHGMSMVVFPEGARTWDGQMRPFKKGAFLLAKEFNLPVVPMTIDGSFDVMPRFRKLPRPGVITLTIHPAIMPPEGGYRRDELMEATFATIASALPR